MQYNFTNYVFYNTKLLFCISLIVLFYKFRGSLQHYIYVFQISLSYSSFSRNVLVQCLDEEKKMAKFFACLIIRFKLKKQFAITRSVKLCESSNKYDKPKS